MHYYRRHLGDYARKAGHLSMLEHGAYNLILDAYYDREVAPTRAEAIRYARARSPEEVAAVDAVLAEFFTERDGRYHQARVEAEFAEVASNAEKNRENGKKGGRPRKNPKETQPKPTGFSEETQTKGNPIVQDSNTQDLKQKQKKRASAPPCPEGVCEQVWTDWLALRRAKSAPVTPTVLAGAIAEAAKAGMSLEAFLSVWCRRGSQGLEAEWLKPNERAGPPPAAPAKPSAAADFRGKTYDATPLDQLPPDLRAAAEAALRDG